MNKLQGNFNQNTKLFIQENASENIVYEMATILSRGDGLMVCRQAAFRIAFYKYDGICTASDNGWQYGILLQQFFSNLCVIE